MSGSKSVIDWRRRTKHRMVEAMGGRCCLCGYNACEESLDFHHLDPNDKEMSFGKVRGNPTAWANIIIELRKCILVCGNCHGEIHYNNKNIPDTVCRFNEIYADYKAYDQQTKERHVLELIDSKEANGQKCGYHKCDVCGTIISDRQKTCSRSCAGKMTKACWTDERHLLLKQYIDEHKTWKCIASEFGVSSVAIVKRAKKLGYI